MTEFRKANELFCSLVEQKQQNDIKNNLRIKIEVLAQNELDSIGSKCKIDDSIVLQGSENLTNTNPPTIQHEDNRDLIHEELIEEESYEDEPHNESSDGTDATKELQQTEEEPTCFLCNAFSGTHDAWTNHLQKAHSKMLPYRCEKCVIVLEDVRDLNDHFRTHRTPFGCLYCVEMFSSKADLDRHISECIGYRCDGCGKGFFLVSLLKEHTCSSSREQKVHIVSRLIGSHQKHKPHTPLFCPVCNEEFASNASLAQHFEREHPTKLITLHRCDLCPQKFTSLVAAREHRIAHKKEQAVKNGKANECSICLKSFKFNQELLLHLEKAHVDIAVTLHQCTKCNRKFTTEAKLQKHDYNTHQGRQPKFFCSFCGRVFNKRIGLQDHENIHRGVKEYRCYECNRHFAYKSSYDRHMQVVHNDAKLFTCEYCQKSFKRKPTLKVHLRLHTGEKPYQCDFCSRRFTDPSSFRKHKQKDHTLTNC
uniref:C2H2-type domain-containing protein n=1 Tax=Anopheles atroparvus TaxID=41427 RepID=A0AAG5D2Y0_ANOAO